MRKQISYLLLVLLISNQKYISRFFNFFIPQSEDRKGENSKWWNMFVKNFHSLLFQVKEIFLNLDNEHILRLANPRILKYFNEKWLLEKANIKIIAKNVFSGLILALQVEPISLIDVLKVLSKIVNYKQDPKFFSSFFEFLNEEMLSISNIHTKKEIIELLKQSPIFLFGSDHLRRMLVQHSVCYLVPHSISFRSWRFCFFDFPLFINYQTQQERYFLIEYKLCEKEATLKDIISEILLLHYHGNYLGTQKQVWEDIFFLVKNKNDPSYQIALSEIENKGKKISQFLRLPIQDVICFLFFFFFPPTLFFFFLEKF